MNKRKPRDWIRALPRPQRTVRMAPDSDTYDLCEAERFHNEDEVGDVAAAAALLTSIMISDGEAATDETDVGATTPDLIDVEKHDEGQEEP